MTQRMRKYKNELCFLGTCAKGQRCNYLKRAPAGVVGAVGDVANTVLRGKLPISTPNRGKLRREIKTLKKLSSKNASLASKKRILSSQKGGSILKTLWNVVKGIFN